jgi:hypothetical protein
MRQHVFAFAMALSLWVVGNLIAETLTQQGGRYLTARPAVTSPAPAGKTIITDEARCQQNDYCWLYYLFSCNGHLPDCNGGCWVTGYFPCSVCYQDPGQTCVQEQVTLNVGLWRSDCTSSSGYYCDACAGNYTRVSDYYVTTLRCC